MKLYDIKIGIKKGEKTFWQTIGTIFCDDSSKLYGENDKPATFAIGFPTANGIVVGRLSKEELAERKAEHDANTEQNNANRNDSSESSGSGDIPF
jgi:hypothetical protein